MEPRFADELQQQPTQGLAHDLRDVERGLEMLPPTQREVLMLLASGLPWHEIAGIVDCPIGTVKSRITRGRAALRAYLEGASTPAVARERNPQSHMGYPEERRRCTMNEDQIKGQWKQAVGKIKAKWGKLTDDDMKIAEGNSDYLSGKI